MEMRRSSSLSKKKSIARDDVLDISPETHHVEVVAVVFVVVEVN